MFNFSNPISWFGLSAAAKAPPGDSVHAWAEAFARWMEGQEDQETRLASLWAWRAFLRQVDKQPWEVNEADVRRWIDQLVSLRYAPATIAFALDAISSFYRYACRQSHPPLADTNPVEGVSLPWDRGNHSK